MSARDIATVEAELVAVRAAAKTNYDRYAGCTNRRAKAHGVRIDAQIKRGAAYIRQEQALVLELAGLQRAAAAPARPPLDLAKLPNARLIRTTVGWYEVVKVNRVTVKVKVRPGMDDLVPVKRIIRIVEWTEVTA